MADSIRVLHVDDEPGFAEMAAELLQREDERITVTTTTDASSGLDKLGELDVDCIVSDYNMPGMNGLEFLGQVREEYPRLPFILFTGRGSEEVASEAVAAGVTDYLQKEGGTDQYTVLANRIENSVTQYRAERRTAEQERILTLLRDVNQALVGASTRNEIEEGVTEILASTEPYVLAWMGEYDAEWERVVPRTVAGIDDDAVAPSALSEEAATRSVVPTAIRTDELAITQQRDPTLAVWADRTAPIEYDAAAVLPIVYHGERYGLLVIYAERSDAFDDDERSMFGEIAGDIAQALHTAEIHRTLGQHRTAVEAVPEGVFVLNEDANIVLVNETAASLIDRSAEEVRGKPFPTFIEQGLFDESIIEWYVDSLREMLSSASDRDEAWYETEIHRPDGESRAIEIHLTLRPYDEEFNGTVGVIRDVTERRAEQERFRALTERSTDITTILTADGAYQYQSPSVERIMGYDPNERLDETPFDYIHPDDRADVRDAFEEALTDPGSTPTVEYRFRHADGSWRWLESHGNNQLDNPAIEGFVVNSRDITDRKQYERELERKNERLDEFAHILSHDLRNPLNVAQGRFELIRNECDSEHINVVADAHDRMEALIDDVLTLARQDQPVVDVESVELAAVADQCWRSVSTAEATLVAETDHEIRADPGRLKQLFENLFRNAVEHGGSDVTITIGSLGDTTGFYVEDDGTGIPPDLGERVFETGYSTAENGTGFGLSIVEQIAQAHEWTVTVTDSDAGGARFEFDNVTLSTD